MICSYLSFKLFWINSSNFTNNNIFFSCKKPIWSNIACFIERAFVKIIIIQHNSVIILYKLAGNLAEDNIITFQISQYQGKPFLRD